MFRKMGREEYCEKENLQQYFFFYVELRTLRNFQKPSQFTFLEDTIRENYEN